MPQSYYTYSNTFVDGQTARATEVADEFQALQTALDDFYDDTGTPAVAAAEAAQAAAEAAQAAAEAAQAAAEAAQADTQVIYDNTASVASYAGEWSNLTGALNIPASVYHDGAFWVLLDDLADVTASEPGITTDWESISKTSISHEVASIFESGTTAYISVTALSATKALVCYADNGNGGSYGTACVLDISGSTITPGTPAVFESAITAYISVTALSSTKALVCYQDGGNSNYGTACVLDISGSTVTPGTPAVFHTGVSAYYINVIKTTSTQGVVVYRRNDTGETSSVVMDVSGSTITPQLPEQIPSLTTSQLYPAAVLLDTGSLAVAFTQGNNIVTIICTLSGSTLTVAPSGTSPMADSSLPNDTAYIKSIFRMDAQNWGVIISRPYTPRGYMFLFRYDSTTGMVREIVSGPVTSNMVAAHSSLPGVLLDTGKLLIAYDDQANSDCGTARIVNITGL